MSDADLEGVVVESSDQYASTALELLFKNLEQRVTVRKALFWAFHDSLWISNRFVEELDLAAASVARLELGCWKDADTAVAIEAESSFEMGKPSA